MRYTRYLASYINVLFLQTDDSGPQQKDEKKKPKKAKEPDIPPASIMKIARESKPEWHYMMFGGLFSAIAGAYPVIMATLFAEVMGVSDSFENVQ